MVKLNREMNLTEVFEILVNNKTKEIDTIDLWWDWFCSDGALVSRGARLLPKLKSLKDSKKFDKDSTYVFFKNNCPGEGPLYDDFRICDKATMEVLYTVIPNEKGVASVWGRANGKPDGRFGQLVEGTWADVKEFFLS